MNQYNCRQLTLRTLPAVHKMYDSLSKESKKYYPSKIYGKPTGLIWFLAQIALVISHTPLREFILHIHPNHIYFIVGMFNQKNDLLGFAHFVVHKRLSNGKLIARLGMAVKDDYQSRGVGSKLVEELSALAKNKNVGKIYLEVLSVNVKAIRLYQRYGFGINTIHRNAGHFKGKDCDIYEMELNF